MSFFLCLCISPLIFLLSYFFSFSCSFFSSLPVLSVCIFVSYFSPPLPSQSLTTFLLSFASTLFIHSFSVSALANCLCLTTSGCACLCNIDLPVAMPSHRGRPDNVPHELPAAVNALPPKLQHYLPLWKQLSSDLHPLFIPPPHLPITSSSSLTFVYFLNYFILK